MTMTTFQLISLILSGIAIVISIVALYRSSSVQRGMIELQISTLIANSQDKVSGISERMLPLLSKSNRSEEEEKTLEGLRRIFNAHVEANINAYEEACAKYIDGKVDRKRFKKNYQVAIRQLVKKAEYEKYFDGIKSEYHAILKVYKEWEHREG